MTKFFSVREDFSFFPHCEFTTGCWVYKNYEPRILRTKYEPGLFFILILGSYFIIYLIKYEPGKFFTSKRRHIPVHPYIYVQLWLIKSDFLEIPKVYLIVKYEPRKLMKCDVCYERFCKFFVKTKSVIIYLRIDV